MSRGRMTEAMAKFRQRLIPDKREAALKAEADSVVAEVMGRKVHHVDNGEPRDTIGRIDGGKPFKVTDIKIGDTPIEEIDHPGVTTPEQAAALSRAHLEATRGLAPEAIQVLAEASGATLTPEELAALNQEREADPTICPRCHVGYAGGLGWNVQRDKCGACGYSGKRRKVAA